MLRKIFLRHLKVFLIFILLIITIDSKTSEGKESIDNLISIIESKGIDWRIQIVAIKKLADSSDPKGLEVLLRLVNDPFLNYDCPALKFHALEALGRYKNDSRITETLINIAGDPTNPLSVREAAINSLGEIGDRRASNLLIKLINDKSFALRLSSIKALGKIGDPSVIPYLEAIKNDDADLSREIHLVLNMIRTNGIKR